MKSLKYYESSPDVDCFLINSCFVSVRRVFITINGKEEIIYTAHYLDQPVNVDFVCIPFTVAFQTAEDVLDYVTDYFQYKGQIGDHIQ